MLLTIAKPLDTWLLFLEPPPLKTFVVCLPISNTLSMMNKLPTALNSALVAGSVPKVASLKSSSDCKKY